MVIGACVASLDVVEMREPPICSGSLQVVLFRMALWVCCGICVWVMCIYVWVHGTSRRYVAISKDIRTWMSDTTRFFQQSVPRCL